MENIQKHRLIFKMAVLYATPHLIGQMICAVFAMVPINS